MLDKKIDVKESIELKNTYIDSLDKRKKILKNTQIKVEDVFGDTKSNNSISPQQINKLNNFLAKMM